MTAITARERQILMHILTFADCSDEAELRAMAARYAKLDEFELGNLPALLERSLEKRVEARKKSKEAEAA